MQIIQLMSIKILILLWTSVSQVKPEPLEQILFAQDLKTSKAASDFLIF